MKPLRTPLSYSISKWPLSSIIHTWKTWTVYYRINLIEVQKVCQRRMPSKQMFCHERHLRRFKYVQTCKIMMLYREKTSLMRCKPYGFNQLNPKGDAIFIWTRVLCSTPSVRTTNGANNSRTRFTPCWRISKVRQKRRHWLCLQNAHREETRPNFWSANVCLCRLWTVRTAPPDCTDVLRPPNVPPSLRSFGNSLHQCGNTQA